MCEVYGLSPFAYEGRFIARAARAPRQLRRFRAFVDAGQPVPSTQGRRLNQCWRFTEVAVSVDAIC